MLKDNSEELDSLVEECQVWMEKNGRGLHRAMANLLTTERHKVPTDTHINPTMEIKPGD